MSASGTATPLENWSRSYGSRSVSSGAQAKPEAAVVKREEVVASSTYEPFTAAHFAVFGCPPDEQAQRYWQSMISSLSLLPPLLIYFSPDVTLTVRRLGQNSGSFTRFRSIRINGPSSVRSPSSSPTYDRLAGKLPQIEQVARLLEHMIGKSLSPRSVIEQLAAELEVAGPSVKGLIEACKLEGSGPFWRLALARRAPFSKREIYAALVDVKTMQTLWRTQWGLQAYEAAYRLSAR